MTDSLKTVTTRAGRTSTPQTQKAAKGQKKNAAGGFTFVVGDMDRARRFLILGSEDNYYTPGVELAAKNAKVLIKLAENDETATDLINLVVQVSTEGRAAKLNPVIFALAIAASHGSAESKAYALAQLPTVLRTGTHLFQFANYIEQFRGWGRGLKRAVAAWYTTKDVDKAAFQAVKYQSREGFSHRDLFRLSHPESQSAEFKGLGEWILRKDATNAPRIVQGFVKAHAAEVKDIPGIVREFGLTWEMLPTEALNRVDVWDALLDGNVPLGALIRQLPRLTRLGVIKPLSATSNKVIARLTDQAEIERARIHPIAILTALKTYGTGRSFRGDSTWTPDGSVLNALDKAFYLAFKNIEPAGKRTLIGLDVSGSMGSPISQDSPLTSREATAALALTMVATEPLVHTIGFTGGSAGGYSGWGYNRRQMPSKFPLAGSDQFGKSVVNLDSAVSAGRRLDDVVRDISGLPFGSTDCSLPMQYAMANNLEVDTFIILTDNDTWSGGVHPHEALAQYRAKMGIDARLIVLSTYASRNTIADPSDGGMLDIAGFDSAAPSLVADFSRGSI